MKNQVIEVLTRDHGAKVIKYWQSHGVDTGPFMGHNNKADGGIGRFYGVINGKFSGYPLYQVKDAGAEIIELPDVSRPMPTESGIHEALARIEAKLDQLLCGNKPKETDKVCSVKDFKVGDGVRVKHWKEIKKLTEKDFEGLRRFDNELIFEYDDRSACGRTGVVMSQKVPSYITILIDRKQYILAPQALEKLKL